MSPTIGTFCAGSARGFGRGIAAGASVPPDVQYLVVAGGGPSGISGGGAGGYRTATGLAVSAGTTYTVVVGAGGTSGNQIASITPPNQGTGYYRGGDSRFGSIYSTGGGHGSSDGGSGGGSHYTTGSSGNVNGYSPSEGNKGGDGKNGSGGNARYVAGGGGGHASAGSNAVGDTPGNGGNGTAAFNGSGYSGGGGGTTCNQGGNTFGSAVGSAGTYGGGAGQAAPANQGAGATPTSSQATSNAGGSGIVVIRYADTYNLAASTTGSPTQVTSGGYHRYTWTGSGSITF